MRALAADIERARVAPGDVAIWWLAQAGFVFKSGAGTVLYVDPYLSNCVEKAFGFKRLTLAPIAAEDVRADWVVNSHEHLDHLDVDALPVVAKNNPGCRFAGTSPCAAEYTRMGVVPERFTLLEPGRQYVLGDVTVSTARADHGELSPTALSLLFDFGGVRVLFTADTALNLPLLQPLIDLNPDVLLPCINGAFGNLDAEQAAQLTARIRPRVVVPCHFWMFKEHHGDPEAFCQACARLCPGTPVRLLTPGEGFVCSGTGVEAV